MVLLNLGYRILSLLFHNGNQRRCSSYSVQPSRPQHDPEGKGDVDHLARGLHEIIYNGDPS